MSSSQNNRARPKPDIGQGQKQVDTAVETKITPIEDVPVPEKQHLDEEISYSAQAPGYTVAKDELLSALEQELAVAKSKLVDIGKIVKNPFHQVGYLVNRAPIERILERTDVGEN